MLGKHTATTRVGALLSLTGVHGMNWYRIKTSLVGLKRLATLPEEDKQACIDAYKFFQRMQAGEETKTEDETKAVADYYKVLNNMLSVFDRGEALHPATCSTRISGLVRESTLDRAICDHAGSSTSQDPAESLICWTWAVGEGASRTISRR